MKAPVELAKDDAGAAAASGATHARHVLVWGTPAAIECGQTFRITVGVKCAAQCRPDGEPGHGVGDWYVEIRDHDGATAATATLGPEPWPDTAALYYTEIELTAPAVEGLHTWTAIAPAQGDRPDMAAAPTRANSAAADAKRPSPKNTGAAEEPRAAEDARGAGHDEAQARFSIRTVPAPECLLTVIAVDRETQSPIAGAKVAVHPYRTVTDSRGIAELRVPKGRYRLFVSGRDHFAFRRDGDVEADTIVRAELEPDLGPSDAELWS